MKPVLYVTVGTSLYESASWDPARAPASAIRGYEVWARADGPDATLLSPEARRLHREALSVRSQLIEALGEANGVEWSGALPETLFGPSPWIQAMRYGAELATLLLYYKEHRGNAETFPDFLGRHEILVAFDSSEQPTDRPRAVVAARHLIAALRRVAPECDVHPWPIEDLSSANPKDLLKKGLPKLLSEIQEVAEAADELVSVILSGGFKIYGIVLGRLLANKKLKLRLVYIYETGSSLVEVESDGVTIGATKARFSDPGAIE